MDRHYYSERLTGTPTQGRIDRANLNPMLKMYLQSLIRNGYFQGVFGHHCPDDGFIPGSLGIDLHTGLMLRLKNPNLWPCPDNIENWSENEVFDVIEFCYDNVAKPIDRTEHKWDNCGWHVKSSDQDLGRNEFRAKMNDFLNSYDRGFTLSERGEILLLLEPELNSLIQSPVASSDEVNIVNRVHAASQKFRRHRPSAETQRDAVRDLFDVLEFLRPKAKDVLNRKDMNDLFEIANRFGIRHHTADQQTSYDLDVWLPWMFHYCLATIHAILSILDKNSSEEPF